MKAWQADGTIKEIDPDQVIINDVTLAPVLDGAPTGEYFVPIIIQQPDGLMRLAKLKKSVMINEQFIKTVFNQYPHLVPVGEAVATYSTALAIGAGTRIVSLSNIENLKAADKLIAIVKPPATLTTGYNVGACVPKADKLADVAISYPALGIGASFSIPLLFYAIRTIE